MSWTHSAAFIGLEHKLDPMIKSYRAQVASGVRRDGRLARLRYLAQANYAGNYISYIRKRSNDPAWLAKARQIESRVLQPFANREISSERAQHFHQYDFHIEHAMVDPGLVEAFRSDLFDQEVYYDPYVENFSYSGHPDEASNPFLYMDSQALVENANFLRICTNPDLIAFCRETLGPAAALSWAWAWISNPGFADYQNQNWHRDSSEPLNFLRVFVPLQDIADEDDGPTAIIPGTSNLREFYDVRRYSDQELGQLYEDGNGGLVTVDAGDIYFINTFALHRGIAPRRRRAILSLLVSLAPSHRTPALKRLKLKDLLEEVRDVVAENRSFFRYIVS